MQGVEHVQLSGAPETFVQDTANEHTILRSLKQR
jgi:hypothetical protein